MIWIKKLLPLLHTYTKHTWRKWGKPCKPESGHSVLVSDQTLTLTLCRLTSGGIFMLEF